MAAEIVYKTTIATNEHIPNDVCTMRKLLKNFQTKNELTFEILFLSTTVNTESIYRGGVSNSATVYVYCLVTIKSQ